MKTMCLKTILLTGYPNTTNYGMPMVVSIVAKAEIAGVFATARIALDERQILADLGHP